MKRFTKILYVAEPSADQGPVLARAIAVAEENQASLTVLDVVPIVGMPAELSAISELPDMQRELVASRRQGLAALLEPHADRDIAIEMREGTRFLEVIQLVLRGGYDLVIKPVGTVSYFSRIFGSDDMHLLRKCPCPLWLARPEDAAGHREVLAAVDFNPGDPTQADRELNDRILDLAASVAVADLATLHVVHAWDAPAETTLRSWGNDPERVVADYVVAERTRHEGPFTALQSSFEAGLDDRVKSLLTPRFHLRRGVPARVIPEVAEQLQAGLVVMGTLGRTGIAGLFIGNTAEAVLEQLRCSVLAIKPAGFRSPVTLAE